MNESRENAVMRRTAELMDLHEMKEQARRSVANDVLAFLDPENCREMALGVADVLQNADMEGWTTDAVSRTGQAIATLLRVAELQENAELEARRKVRHKELEAEQAQEDRSDLLRSYAAGILAPDEAAEVEGTLTADEIAELRRNAEYQSRSWRKMLEQDEAALQKLDALEAEQQGQAESD